MPSHPLHLEAADGRTLAATHYTPDGPPVATVVLLGAYAVRQRYYRRFATWLAEHGFSVLTFDTRGIGDSRDGPIRDERATATDWAVLDHGAALRWAADQAGTRLAVAHSFGGQILGVTDEAACLDGVYAVGSQLGWWGYQDTAWGQVKMRALTTVLMPALNRTFGYLPGWTGIGEDVPYGAMAEWVEWMRTSEYLLPHVPGARERYVNWPGQVSLLGFTDDFYAPPRAVEALGACFDSRRTETRVMAPTEFALGKVGHFGFFRNHAGNILWEDARSRLEGWSNSATRHRASIEN